MKQNKYFSTGRFARLFRNDLLINQKIYLFAAIGLGLGIYAFTYFIMATNRLGFNRQEDYIPLLIFYTMGIGVLIGTSFPAFTNQIKTGNYLMAPGSNLEKFLVQFAIRIVILIPLVMLLFWLGTRLAKASIISDPAIGFDASAIPDFHFEGLFHQLKSIDKLALYGTFISVISILFCGSVFFKRFALIKTLILTALMVGAVILTFVLFSHLFYPAETHGFDIELKTYKITENLFNVQLAAYLLGGLSWLFFLPLAYFKLKEKEV